MNTLVHNAGARAPAQSLARLTAQQILDGYRSGRFTPRDVIDEVIAALETTDARCKVIATEMFASARAEAHRATAAWKNGEAKALTGVPITIKGFDLRRRHPGKRRRADAGRLRAGHRFRRRHRRQSRGRDRHLQDHDLRVRL